MMYVWTYEVPTIVLDDRGNERRRGRRTARVERCSQMDMALAEGLAWRAGRCVVVRHDAHGPVPYAQVDRDDVRGLS